MKVLIVGAGAVGQVYGYHLQAGGAELGFYVRPRYVDSLRDGVTVYPLNRRNRSQPVRFAGYSLYSTPEEVRAERWDQLWLAISSPALRGPWLGELVAAVPEATVVCLTPGIDSRRIMEEHLPSERLVMGLISLISYQAPLPGEERFAEPGMAWWFPPRGASPFAGPPDAVQAVVRTLRGGGQPARAVAEVEQRAALASTMLMPQLLALESVGWSWVRLRQGDRLARGCAAVHEALAAVAAHKGLTLPASRHLIRPSVLRLVLAAAPRLIPLDLETYLAYHFTKVGSQTRAHVRRYQELARAQGMPTPALDELFAEIPEEPGDPKAVAARVASA